MGVGRYLWRTLRRRRILRIRGNKFGIQCDSMMRRSRPEVVLRRGYRRSCSIERRVGIKRKNRRARGERCLEHFFCEVEATTGFEPVNGGFANLWLTTCLRRQASIAMQHGPAWSSPQLFDCLIHYSCTPSMMACSHFDELGLNAASKPAFARSRSPPQWVAWVLCSQCLENLSGRQGTELTCDHIGPCAKESHRWPRAVRLESCRRRHNGQRPKAGSDPVTRHESECAVRSPHRCRPAERMCRSCRARCGSRCERFGSRPPGGTAARRAAFRCRLQLIATKEQALRKVVLATHHGRLQRVVAVTEDLKHRTRNHPVRSADEGSDRLSIESESSLMKSVVDGVVDDTVDLRGSCG